MAFGNKLAAAYRFYRQSRPTCEHVLFVYRPFTAVIRRHRLADRGVLLGAVRLLQIDHGQRNRRAARSRVIAIVATKACVKMYLLIARIWRTR